MDFSGIVHPVSVIGVRRGWRRVGCGVVAKGDQPFNFRTTFCALARNFPRKTIVHGKMWFSSVNEMQFFFKENIDFKIELWHFIIGCDWAQGTTKTQFIITFILLIFLFTSSTFYSFWELLNKQKPEKIK